MLKQRIHRYRQSARVGRSALSTPAIFKALAEMLEPFSFLVFSVQVADSPLPTISACWVFGSLPPAIFMA
ncbi:hypothetical protein [Photobacterium swingsii]|uniref:hypothetical protein n=1 Tax=Photobacterium swingsii TaxID=680026 RepID=UPI004067714D